MQAIKDAIKTVSFHYRTGNLNYPMIIYISLVHIAAIVGLFAIQRCKWQTLLWAFVLWPIR
jgi:stearoyl-CoA desaturase (Delta-9 desaturase)